MIVFCTNIAETSLTIPNVRLIIDSGLVNEGYIDPDSRVTVIEIQKISRASADQRKGGAGRTEPGHCVRLYNEDELVNLDTKPQILRSSLDLVLLQLISVGLNPREFAFMDPPDEKHIEASLNVLKDLSCIDTAHLITRKGELFTKLCIDPRCSAVLFDAYLEHADILELAVIIAAFSIAPGSVFSIDDENKEEKNKNRYRIATGAKIFDSDLLYFVSIYKRWRDVGIINPENTSLSDVRKIV